MSARLTSIHDIKYPNIVPSGLEDINIDYGRCMMTKMVFTYMDRLLVCSNYKGEQCYSWDVRTGVSRIHEPLNKHFDAFFGYSFVPVNGKMWLHGGDMATMYVVCILSSIGGQGSVRQTDLGQASRGWDWKNFPGYTLASL